MVRPLSLQLFTLREEMAEPGETLRRLAEIGYDAVEPHRPTDDPQGLRASLDACGLRVSAAHARIHAEDPGPYFEAAAILGTDRLIVPGGIPHEEFTSHDGLERTAKLLNGLAERAAEEGIRIGYHNHWWEFEPRVGGRHAYDVLADLLDPAVFLEVDTYWAAVGGADVVSLLQRLEDRVHALHVKDGPVVKDEPHTAVGQGAMPVAEIIAAAPRAQLVVELDTCATDTMTAVVESHRYLTSLLARGQV